MLLEIPYQVGSQVVNCETNYNQYQNSCQLTKKQDCILLF